MSPSRESRLNFHKCFEEKDNLELEKDHSQQGSLSFSLFE